MSKKYLSKINKGGYTIYVKDEEARDALVPFGASGTNHSAGLVPDPGSTQGTTKFLREDGSWQQPAGGGTTVVAVSGSTPTQALSPNTHYVFGTVTSLTVTLGSPVNGSISEYTFEFDSGSTATTLSVPATVEWIDAGWQPLTNMHYEINIKYNATTTKYYGLVAEWAES